MDTTSAHPKILLASQSPRRRRLLGWLGLEFESVSVDTPESLETPLASRPAELAVSLAVEKVVATREIAGWDDRIILCFDTIVVLDGGVLGKPTDDEDARRMLRSLSGRSHQVVTGMALWFPDASQPITSAVTTNVVMNVLDEEAIDTWLEKGEHLGCAGAYNIEGQIAGVDIDECFQNVAGLPLCHLYPALAEHLDPNSGLTRPCARCDAALGRTCELGPRLLSLGSNCERISD